MSITTSLLKVQDIRFDTHNRGKSVEKFDGIHFHKK